jgi:hypothetical protein
MINDPMPFLKVFTEKRTSRIKFFTLISGTNCTTALKINLYDGIKVSSFHIVTKYPNVIDYFVKREQGKTCFYL